MNTYTITARAVFGQEYIVEAESEDDAIYKVEYGEVEPEYSNQEEVMDIEVTSDECEAVERYANLGVTFVTRGEVRENYIQDALYTLLQVCDGMTVDYNGAELEIVGFSVDHVEEAK